MISAQEIHSAVERVNALRTEKALVFPIFTDLHIHSIDEPAVTELQTALAGLAAEMDVDAVWDLGDNPAMLGREHHASNDEIYGVIHELLMRSGRHWARPLYPVNGNHDGIGTDFFDPTFWERIIGDTMQKGNAVRKVNTAYYFVDFPKSKIRAVVLSLPSGCDLAAEKPTPIWQYGDAQLQWLANEALDTDYSVVIFAHVPFYYEFTGDNTILYEVFDGQNGRIATRGALCGWIHDRAEAERILHAFAAHQAYDNAEKGIHLKPAPQESTLIAFMSGHTHKDAIWAPGEERGGLPESDALLRKNTLPCPQVISGATYALNANDAALQMDIAVFSPENRTLTMVRLGRGEDRRLHW